MSNRTNEDSTWSIELVVNGTVVLAGAAITIAVVTSPLWVPFYLASEG